MAITKQDQPPRLNIRVGAHTIKQTNNFNYLGSLITPNGRCETEIRRKIAMAKNTFGKIKKPCNKNQIITECKKKVCEMLYIVSFDVWV